MLTGRKGLHFDNLQSDFCKSMPPLESDLCNLQFELCVSVVERDSVVK
jgi:hypothetical protein